MINMDLMQTYMYIGLIIVLTYMMYTFVQRKRNTKTMPGPIGIPLLGSAIRINPRIAPLQLHELASKFGKIFELSFFHKKAVVISDMDLIEKAFVRDGEYFNDRPCTFIGDEFNFSQTIGARCLNEGYRFARKAFTKGIHLYGSGLHKFEEIVSGELKRLVQEIDDYDGGEFEVTRMIKRSVLNIMSILMIGMEATDEDAEAVDDYMTGLQYFLTPFNHVVLSSFPFLKHLPAYKREIRKVKESQKKICEKYFYQTLAYELIVHPTTTILHCLYYSTYLLAIQRTHMCPIPKKCFSPMFHVMKRSRR